jgi:hypothetical protein
MAERSEVNLSDPAASYLPGPSRNGPARNGPALAAFGS